MSFSKSFYDVCVSADHMLKETCQTLIDLGFQTIAVNQHLEEPASESKKKKKKGEAEEASDLVPPPICLAALTEVLKGKVKLINRLTFSFSDHLHVHKMTQCKNLRKYHLLAAIPTTQTALQIACSSLDVDIISFDPGRKWHFRLKRKQYNMAVERGLFFELMYSPAILDATARRNLIQTAHMYHSCGKSKNIIISSGGSHPFHIRGPYDIINLGLIFGLSEEQAKNAITGACRTLLLHGEGRRFGKAVAFIAQDGASENDHIVKTATSLGDESDHDGEFQSAHKKFRH
ncbi:ribonuclease P protein subunit p30 [Anabrus simplex]|uniref:ribonuclease P protein subunit p30 n=1 Tax=Anabrus simplex TaxID=316456 RepID=UPI0034DD4BFF